MERYAGYRPTGDNYDKMAGVGGNSLTRVLSGLVLIPVIVYAVLYAEPVVLFALTLIISLISLSEYNGFKLAKEGAPLADWAVIALGAALVSSVYAIGLPALLPLLLFSIFLLLALSLYFAKDLKESLMGAILRLFGLTYIALPLSYIVALGWLYGGRLWIFFIFVIIWSNDTLAYVCGRAFGRHKLCPTISPGKTVEGLIGGLLGGIIAAIAYKYASMLSATIAEAVILALIIGVIGVLGDLMESLLKRGAGVKDSGRIIPGHGGVLDRIDSLIFTFPAVYYYLILR